MWPKLDFCSISNEESITFKKIHEDLTKKR